MNAPTREANLSGTVIDLLFTNSENLICDVDNINTISDHNFIKIKSKNVKKSILSPNIKEIVCWFNYSEEKLVNFLFDCDWNMYNNLSNVNEKALCLINFLKSAVQKLTVKKSINCDIKQPWYNNELRSIKKDMCSFKIKYNSHKSKSNWKNYVKIRNKYKNTLRSKSNNYVQNKLMENKNDPKKLWKILNNLCKKKPKVTKSVKFNSINVENDMQIAEKFNSFFIDSIKDIQLFI